MAESTPWLTAGLVNRLVSQAAATDQDLPQALSGFLEVLDSVDRLALLAAAQPGAEADSGWSGHLAVLRRQMLEAFERAGVAFFEDEGESFDPARHQAVATQLRSDVPDYTIVEVLARGCTWRGKLLRYSRVVVARNES